MAIPRVPRSWLERLLGGSDYVYDGQTVQADEVELEGDGVELTKISEGRVRLTISGGGADVPEAGPETDGTLVSEGWQKLNWRYLDYSDEPTTWSNLVEFDRSSFQVFASETAQDLIIAINPVVPVQPGREAARLLQAGSFSSLAVPSAWGDGDVSDALPPHWDIPDPDKPYFFSVTSVTETLFVSVGRVVKDVTVETPALVSASIDLGTDDELAVTWDRNVLVPSTTGLTLTSPSRTITSLLSGNNTPNHVYQLSAAIGDEDEPSLVIGNNRAVQTLNGFRPATGSHAVSVTGSHETADLPGLTLHLRADLGNGSISDGAQCASWASQVGSITFAQATGSLRPVLDVDGVNGHPGLESDGTDDVMTSAVTGATLFGAGGNDYCVFACFRLNAASDTNSTYNGGHGILADAGGGYFMPLAFHRDAGVPTVAHAFAYVYDGTVKYIGGGAQGGIINVGDDVYLTLRHTGGTVRLYVNGTLVDTDATIGAFHASALTQTARIFRGAGSNYAAIDLHEVAVCSPDPGDSSVADQHAYYAARLA